MLKAFARFRPQTFNQMRMFSSKGYVTDKAELNSSKFPTVAQRSSFKVDLVKGETYYWCSCGKSANQPLCDGSHKETEFVPVAYTHEEENRTRGMCGCKMSKDSVGPFCDGSHKRIDFDNLEKAHEV